MASYKDIQGFNIQNLSSDPVPFAQEKANNPYQGTWASGGTMNTARNSLGSTGTKTAALAFGGVDPSPAIVAFTESYNGTSWTEVNDLNSARKLFAGSGTNTAALAFGGRNPPADTNRAFTETWDGTNWTEVADLNTARGQLAGFGATNTAAIATGGGTPTVTGATELWNGTSWTEVNDLNTARRNTSGSGTSTAGIVAGGEDPGQFANTETWNGTSWTEVNDLNTARLGLGVTGTTTSALAFAGVAPPLGPPNYQALTESWDGSSWTEVNDLSGVRGYIGRAGSDNTSALAFGGINPTVNLATTEEWAFTGIPPSAPAAGYTDAIVGQIYYNTTTGSFKAIGAGAGSWASGANMPTARQGLRSGGTPTAAILWGGDDSFAQNPATFEYDGTTWTTGGSTSTTGWGYGGGVGSQTNALSMGGYNNAPNSVANAETYNGTSWTTITSLPTGLYNMGTATLGTGSLGNALGGRSGPSLTEVASNQQWNGSAWTELGDLTATSYAGNACGTPSAAIYFGGTAGLSNIWNGTSWTSVPATLNTTPRNDQGMSGSSTSALIFGGPPTASTNTELWDGTSWTEVNNLGTARLGKNGRGSQVTNSDTAITMGGYGPPVGLVNTEEWTTTDFTINTLTTS